MIHGKNLFLSLRAKVSLGLVLGVCFLPVWSNPAFWVAAKQDTPVSRPPAQATEPKVNYDALPIRFEPNHGQAAASIRYLARGRGYNLLFAPQEIALTLRRELTAASDGADAARRSATETIRWQFVGANPRPEIIAEEALPGRTNYLLGAHPAAWQTNLPTYARLRYRNLYPGIDLVFYGSHGQLEYDFVIAPGANPNVIRLAFSGTTNVAITPAGNLWLQTAQGGMEQMAPQVYQTIAGARRAVAGKYKKVGRQQVAFTLGQYDARQPLVIDPVLVYSTYYGGNSLEQGLAIALDKDGNMYVTGDTLSTDFRTVNPMQGTLNGTLTDAFVLKLNPAGTQVVYATYVGSNGSDTANAIAVDANGNAYLTGQTSSPFFPGASLTPRIGAGGNLETFVCKLNPAGSSIVYGTLLGGNNADVGNAIAVNGQSEVYVAGRTDSTNLPASGIQSVKRGSPLFKSANQAANWTSASNGLTAASVRTFAIHPNGPDFLYAGTISGLYFSYDNGVNWLQPTDGARLSSISSIVIDPTSTHTIYVGSVSGFSKSNNDGSTFEILNRNVAGGGAANIFALALAPTNPATLYAGTPTGVFKSTNGGTSWSAVNNGLRVSPTIATPPLVNHLAIAPGSPNTVYAATNAGMYKTTDAGASWTAINTGLSDGLGIGPNVSALALDASNPTTLYAGTGTRNFYKTTNGGATWQRTSSGPVSDGAPPTITTIAIDPTNPATLYVGGSAGVFKTTDRGESWLRVVNGLTNLTVQGLVVSPTNPTTIFAGTISGAEAYVAKLNADGIGAQWLTYLGGDEFDEVRGLTLDAAGNVYVAGTTTSTNFPTTANCFQPTMAGIGDAFVTKINPTGTALVYSTYLGSTSSDSGRGIALNAQGEAYVTGSAGAPSFPTLNSLQPFANGSLNIALTDAFVARLKADGTGLLYSTFLGGAGQDSGAAIALDAAGNAYVTGSTQSSDFPMKGAFQPTLAGGADAFVAKINPAGSALLYASYLGGGNTDAGNGIAVDQNGDAHIVGNTASANFPTVNSLQPARAGSEIFIVKLGPSADLAVTLNASAATINLGDNLTYTMQVTNQGELPATDVKLSDQLPAGTTVVSATTSQGACSGTGTITCSLGTLASGASATVTLVVKLPAVATITNSVTVTGVEKEATLANNTASVETKVLFTDVALSVAASHLQIEPGKNLTWILSVKNNGPLSAKDLRLTDNLPADVEFVSCQALGKGVCGGTGNNRLLTVAELAWGETETFVIVGKVKGTVAEGTTLTHQSAVVATPPDNVPVNNQERSTITVIKPDLTPIKNGKLAFISNKTGAGSLAVMRPDGSGRFLWLSGASPLWSPDGTMLAFTTSSYELMVINADGTGLRKLPISAPYPYHPTWSPDGKRLAFNGPFGVYTIQADGTNERQMFSPLPTLLINARLRWSPDGSRFVFGNSGWNNNGIATIYLDGTGLTPLTRPPADSRIVDDDPAWSRDGARIVFARRTSTGIGNIYVMNADGTGVQQLTTGNHVEYNPVFSPDGAQIAFVRNGEIWMMNADGTNPRQVSNEKAQYGTNHVTWQREPVGAAATYVISGRVLQPTGRFAYPKIELSGAATATTTIEPDGMYSFGNLPVGGNYTVTVSDPSYLFTPSSRTFTNLQGDQANMDFTAAFNGRTISGRIVDADGKGIEGVRVGLSSNRGQNIYAFTDGNGDYRFNDLFSGIDYTVAPLGYASNELYTPRTISFPALSENKTANFTGQREKLSLMTTLLDRTGAAVSGATITVSGLNGVAANSVTATTGNDGKASFADLLSGYVYVVTAKKDGLKIEPATRRIVMNKNWELDFYSGISAAASVSAASYSQNPVTPDGIVSLFGTNLASAPKPAEGGLAYNLDGVTVAIEGSDGLSGSCLLFYVSPTQINYLVPYNIAPGEAVVRVSRDNKVVGFGTVQVATVAPGLFAMNQNGSGVAAASVLRVKANGSFSYEFPYAFDAATQKYTTRAIDLGPDLGNDTEQIFLELYGTGIRRRSLFGNVTAKIGGTPVEVSYAGPQNHFAGLDQVNVKLPRSLMGRGEVTIELSVDGKVANGVIINIK